MKSCHIEIAPKFFFIFCDCGGSVRFLGNVCRALPAPRRAASAGTRPAPPRVRRAPRAAAVRSVRCAAPSAGRPPGPAGSAAPLCRTDMMLPSFRTLVALAQSANVFATRPHPDEVEGVADTAAGRRVILHQTQDRQSEMAEMARWRCPGEFPLQQLAVRFRWFRRSCLARVPATIRADLQSGRNVAT